MSPERESDWPTSLEYWSFGVYWSMCWLNRLIFCWMTSTVKNIELFRCSLLRPVNCFLESRLWYEHREMQRASEGSRVEFRISRYIFHTSLSCCKSLASMGAYLVEPDAWPPLLSASNSLELKTWPPWEFGVSCTGSARWWEGEKYQWNLPMSPTGLRWSPVLLQRLHSESLLRDVAVLGTDVIEGFLMGMFSAEKWLSFREGTGDLHSQGIMDWFPTMEHFMTVKIVTFTYSN